VILLRRFAAGQDADSFDRHDPGCLACMIHEEAAPPAAFRAAANGLLIREAQ